jgi:hypothetical protein
MQTHRSIAGKVMPSTRVPDNRAQDADVIPSRNFSSVPSNRGPAASPHGSPPAPLDPASGDHGADSTARGS